MHNFLSEKPLLYGGLPVSWEGPGIYRWSEIYKCYVRAHDLRKLEDAMSDGEPVCYIKLSDTVSR